MRGGEGGGEGGGGRGWEGRAAGRWEDGDERGGRL